MAAEEDDNFFHTRIGIINHATRQDFFFCIICMISFAFLGLLFVAIVVSHVADLIYKAYKDGRDSGYIPPEVKPGEIPPRTYFLLRKNKYSPFLRLLMGADKHYATWSFYFFNIIFCPNFKKRDILGTREMQLTHEFSHCGKSEFLIATLTFLASSIMVIFVIIAATVVSFFEENAERFYYLYTTMLCFALYMIFVGSMMMRRREFIADYKAYNRAGKPYLDWICNRAQAESIVAKQSLKERFFSFLRWHPTMAKRKDFLLNQKSIPLSYILFSQVNAFFGSLIASHMAMMMTLPLYSPFSVLFDIHLGPLTAMIIFFTFCSWICWLIARCSSDIKPLVVTGLTFSYTLGTAFALFSFMCATYLVFPDVDYNMWHFMVPWGASLVWLLVSLVVIYTPFLRKAPTLALATYILFGLLFGFTGSPLFQVGNLRSSLPAMR